jgi:hypothetical protein
MNDGFREVGEMEFKEGMCRIKSLSLCVCSSCIFVLLFVHFCVALRAFLCCSSCIFVLLFVHFRVALFFCFRVALFASLYYTPNDDRVFWSDEIVKRVSVQGYVGASTVKL